MSNLQRRILWTALALLMIALPAIALVAPKLKKKPQSTITPPTTRVEISGSSKSKERVEGEIIAVTPHGFEPSQLSRPHKHFVLVLDNQSGLNQIELRLDREKGGRVREVQVIHEKRNWSDDLDLPPGRYVLSEANHPSWSCSITITPN
jgi:hypothetical protein